MKAIDARAGSRIKLPAAGGALGKPAFFLRLRPACKVSDAVLRIRCAFFFALHRFGTILFPTAFFGCIRADKIRRRFYYMFFGDKVNGESVNYSAARPKESTPPVKPRGRRRLVYPSEPPITLTAGERGSRSLPALRPHPVLCFSAKSIEPPSPSQGTQAFLRKARWLMSRPSASALPAAGTAGMGRAFPYEGKAAKAIFFENCFRRMRWNIGHPPTSARTTPHTQTTSADADLCKTKNEQNIKKTAFMTSMTFTRYISG